ncbi:MAG: addiction module antidote protein, HigA family [Desulfovibrio sp.]|nr:MAG: addiction module antidote protein, HigA family [Desulfovibrio sp.]
MAHLLLLARQQRPRCRNYRLPLVETIVPLDRIPLIPPGEILQEEFLKPLGLSQNRLGMDLRIPAQRIGQIIKGKRAITLDTALRLATYFDTSPEFWLNLQMHYDLRKAEQDQLVETIRKEVRPRDTDPPR